MSRVFGGHPMCALLLILSCSHISSAQSAASLTRIQIDNLALLGKVWGFAKYHHPVITSGGADWDAQLRLIVPSVMKTSTRAEAAAALRDWIERVGEVPPCNPCASIPRDPHLQPDLAWIRDERLLGSELSKLLMDIHAHRRYASKQAYVSFRPNIGNPIFDNEKPYADASLPAADLRLLALYRFWNIIAYWFPYRDLIDDDWDAVLREFIPMLWSANDSVGYRRAMMMLIARVKDTHANLWSSLDVRPPVGAHKLPVVVRFIEGKAVVAGFAHDSLGAASGLQIGDAIEAIDGKRVDAFVEEWTPYYAASNDPTRLRDIARSLTQGPPGPTTLTVERAGLRLRLAVQRVPSLRLDRRAGTTHDLRGQAFQMLTNEVAYLKLSAVSVDQATDYINKAGRAKVLVIDIRNYPSDFMVFALGQHLVSKPTEFARFTFASGDNPGFFKWTPAVSLVPKQPFFGGSVVILIDEMSQSQAEYTAMAFRSAPNAIVVGSTTAGADGNVSRIPLPGGIRSMISGIGVFYPDRKPTQRIGIIPDLVVLPTIAGIRAGRDEVLEAAVARALGRTFRLTKAISN